MTRPPAAGETLAAPTARAPQAVATHEPAPAAGRPAAPELAARWRRLVAFGIDALILTLVTGALWGRLLASFASRMDRTTSTDPGDPAARSAASGAVGRVIGHTVGPYVLVLVATIIVAILYYWLLTGYWGTTIGKRSVGLWVVSASDRTPVSLPGALLRALIFVAGGEIVPLFFIADNGWLLADRRRQTLHDKAARTLVVRRSPRPAGVSRRSSTGRPR